MTVKKKNANRRNIHTLTPVFLRLLYTFLVALPLAASATWRTAIANPSQTAANQPEKDKIDMAVDSYIFPHEPRMSWMEVASKIPQPEKTPEIVTKGKEAYERYCSSCHGADGRGDGPVAQFMVVKPRDYTKGLFKLKTTNDATLPTDMDIFRSITVGFPPYGMPDFHHLDETTRWALAYTVKDLYRDALEKKYRQKNYSAKKLEKIITSKLTPGKGVVIGQPPAVTPELLMRGKFLFEKTLDCKKCHGIDGHGDGPSANELKDEWGYPVTPRDFGLGKAYFKGGAGVTDVARTISVGIAGTPMPSSVASLKDGNDLWAIAYHVVTLTDKGIAKRRAEWRNFFANQLTLGQFQNITLQPPEENWDTAVSQLYENVSQKEASENGCLSCHNGIEDINDKMMPTLIAMGGGTNGRSCVVCHEGNPDATTRQEAHKGVFPNPGSMWVVSYGKGCGKCHSSYKALTSLQANAFPDPLGGEVMNVISTATDASGATGGNHVYRMQRGLMALEFGKASHTLMSNGVVPKGDYVYADFNMDDPDGPVPTAGTPAYKALIKRFIESGAIVNVNDARQIPDFYEGKELWGDEVKASISDMYRKQCARCHIWEEGRRKRGDLRAGGCSACHVLYTNDAVYEGGDPTIPREKGKIHPMKHQITLKIPAQQCNHCHTRGKRIGTTYVGMFEYDYKSDQSAPPFDEEGNFQDKLYTKDYLNVRKDLHFERGMHCVDCHTSVDVHGDGNVYPTTLHQVEIECHDCHGTPKYYPWELPVGYGERAPDNTPRGLYISRNEEDTGDTEYLLSNRGNPRKNTYKVGDKAYLVSYFTDKVHEMPLLKNNEIHNNWKTEQGRVAMSIVSEHMEKLECYACHSTWAPQCYGCHMKYDRRKTGTDWIGTAMNHDVLDGKQRIVKSPGDVYENRSFMRWEKPILGVNMEGKVSPLIPGCQTLWTYVNEEGEIVVRNKSFTTSDGFPSPTLAPVQAHANTIPARTCENCHTDPKSIGYGEMTSRSMPQFYGDKPLFADNEPGVYGDIPGAETAKPQVPGMPDVPYAWDQLVTRSGKQLQNMPHKEDRPLNKEERDKVEREGLCIACHKFYRDVDWQIIRDKYGKALTPDDHDKMMERAIKALMEKAVSDTGDDRATTRE